MIATATCFVAVLESGPGFNHTVYGTGACVTAAMFGERGALRTTVLSKHYDRPRSGMIAAITESRAITPLIPNAHFTVDWAREHIAGPRSIRRRARRAIACLRLVHTARAVLAARCAALVAARAPRTPGTQHAIQVMLGPCAQLAHLRIAWCTFDSVGAWVTAKLRLLNDLPQPRTNTAAA